MGVPSVPSRTPEAFTFMDGNCRSLLQSQSSISLSTPRRQDFLEAEMETMTMATTTISQVERETGLRLAFFKALGFFHISQREEQGIMNIKAERL